jgi:hypothetical protein
VNGVIVESNTFLADHAARAIMNQRKKLLAAATERATASDMWGFLKANLVTAVSICQPHIAIKMPMKISIMMKSTMPP